MTSATALRPSDETVTLKLPVPFFVAVYSPVLLIVPPPLLSCQVNVGGEVPGAQTESQVPNGPVRLLLGGEAHRPRLFRCLLAANADRYGCFSPVLGHAQGFRRMYVPSMLAVLR